MTAPVVACPTCDGKTFTLDPCRCLRGGGDFLVNEEWREGPAWPDCALCRGVGTVARPCRDCDLSGRRRAQLVVTVANLDTGAVASISYQPGELPTPGRSPDGGWRIDLTPTLRGLTERVGVASMHRVGDPAREVTELSLPLPSEWRPELPVGQRHAIETAALVHRCHHPWIVLIGRSVPPPPVDPGAALARLVTVADLLLLDLVVEARRAAPGSTVPVWSLRYELPGAEVPATSGRSAQDLPTALTRIGVSDALSGLAERCRTVPAHYVAPTTSNGGGNRARDDGDGAGVADVDRLERRILGDLSAAGPDDGAQAIWRDGRWWHITLRHDGVEERLTEWETGQVQRRRLPRYVRGWEPPPPSWLGAPMPYVICPDCRPGLLLRACFCTAGRAPVGLANVGPESADPDCVGCRGAGVRPTPEPCFTCGDTGRIPQAVVLTVTDLAGRAEHVLWRVGDDGAGAGAAAGAGAGAGAGARAGAFDRAAAGIGRPLAELVGTQPGGKPVVQLAARFRLNRRAADFGVRPEELADLIRDGHVDQDLRYGYVTLPHSGVDPLGAYLAQAGRGRPGARILIGAAAPAGPTSTELARLGRLALGLGLALRVTAQDHRLHAGDPVRCQGVRWEVDVVPVDAPVTEVDPPGRLTLGAAVAYGWYVLELALADTVPTDPAQPIAVPQAPANDTGPSRWAGLEGRLRRIAYDHPSEAVSVQIDRRGEQVHTGS